MFHRIAVLVTTRSRTVLVVGVLGLIAATYLGVTAFAKLQPDGFDDPASESSRAAEVLTEEFGGAADYVFVVGSDDARLTTEDLAAGRELTERLESDPGLTDVTSYFVTEAPSLLSDDGRHALITATSPGGSADPAAVLEEYGGDQGDLMVRVGGSEAVSEEVSAQIGSDLGLAESIAIPLILVLLVLAFGNVVAALVTLGVGLMAVLGTFAELSVLGSVTDVSIYAVNLTTGLGLGLAVDYGLLMVARVREERAAGRDTQAAVVRAVETAGRTIAFSATTVAVALASLLVFPQYFLRSFAYAGVGVMLITASSAVILLPAALTLLGGRIDAWRVPGVRGIRGGAAPFWHRLAGVVTRHPVLTAAPVLVLLGAMTVPLLGVAFGTPDDRVLPTSASSRQAGDLLRDEFASDDSSPIEVVATSSMGDDALATYAVELSDLAGVARVDTRLGSFADGAALERAAPVPSPAEADVERISVVTGYDSHSSQARELVGTVRGLEVPGGTETLVGGSSAALQDSMSGIGGRIPIALGWMVLTTFVTLFLFTGSLVQPLRALLLNALGLSATLGAMVWVFQEGHLSGLLGFTPLPMDTSMMVLLFCIAFGLSMDYEVFVMGRIKEARDLGYPNRDAVVRGLAHSGRIVTTAAVLIAISFFAFVISEISFIQFFGLGTGLAILIDATLIRGVLLPAGISLLGERAWWAPAPLRALHRRIGPAEATAVGPAPAETEPEYVR